MRLPTHKVFSFILLSFGLACFYFVLGKFGTFFSVPPGYGTLVWVPSGLALAAYIVFGVAAIPGIFLGAFLHNIGVAASFETFNFSNGVVALMIGVGSSLQAFIAGQAIKSWLGNPINLQSWKQLGGVVFFLLPLCALVSCSISVTSLYYCHVISIDDFWNNWRIWWLGDFLGILIFTPAFLFLPKVERCVLWKDKDVAPIPVLAVYLLLIPMGITFYTWKTAERFLYERNLETFRHQVIEAEKAFEHRIDSYEFALKGARGFFLGSDYVSLQEWDEYVASLEIDKNFVGVNGVGWIARVANQDLPHFLENNKAEYPQGFLVHPDLSLSKYYRYIITYIAPESRNGPAIGLDVSFEPNRFHAANLAMDTGETTITRRITLVQDANKTPGFLMYVPLYKKGWVDTKNVDERRKNLTGWVYAPFTAKSFMKDIVAGQGQSFHVRVYDGEQADENSLLYDSNKLRQFTEFFPFYTITRHINVKQVPWTIVFESTPAFEGQVRSYEPLLIILGGGIITLILAAFLYFLFQREEVIRCDVEAKTKALSESDQRYDLAVKGMSVGLWDWDVVTGKMFWSEHLRRILGIPADVDASDVAFMARVHPDDLEAVNEDIQRHYREGTPHDMEFRMRHEDGHYIWVHGSGQTDWNEEGAPVRMAGSIADISSRKYTEEALLRSEELNNLAVRGMSVGLWDWNILSGEITTSYKMHEILGWNIGSDFVANFNDFVTRVHPDDIERVSMAINAHLVHRTPYDVECRLQVDDGNYIWLQVCGQGKWDENGKPIRMVGSIANIDDRKKAEEKLVQSNLELERFAYVASHDLQEPLRMVRSFTQILKEEYGDKFDEQATEYMGFIINGATRMQALVSDLLEYSRADKQELDLQDIECDSIMRAVGENLKGVLEESGGRIYYDKLPVVWANPVQLMRLLQNLVGNALKYRKKDVKPDVSVHVEDDKDTWLFSVSDNGIGIKPEYLDQVFVLFKRLHRNSEYEGTGIGLAICKKVVENMGGEIWVESEYGVGSTFYFTIPKNKQTGVGL